MTSTILLQSPSYAGGGFSDLATEGGDSLTTESGDTLITEGFSAGGESFLMPVASITHHAASKATMLALPGAVGILQDFAQVQEAVTLTGFLTDQNAVEAGFANAVHFADGIRRTRRVWPRENVGASGPDWNNSTLPAAERDTEARSRAKARLILDKAWNAGTQQFVNLFLYGAVLVYHLGPIPAATMRARIPYAVTFIVSDVKVGASS